VDVLARVTRTGDTDHMTLLAVLAAWLVLSLVLGLVVVALCRAGHDEDEHRDHERRVVTRPRRRGASA
jgi:hypothetical protein